MLDDKGLFTFLTRNIMRKCRNSTEMTRLASMSANSSVGVVRRTAMLLPMALLLSLLGCGASPKREIGWQEYPFTLKAEAQCRERFGENGADIRLTATAPGEGELEFLAPDSLKGLCVSVHDGEGELRLGELCSPLCGSVLDDALALFSLTALDTSRMTDISLEDGAGSVNVAQITLCLPTDDDAETDNDGQISERTGGRNKNDADSSNDGAETVGILTVRIDSETGNPLEMQADFISGEALRLRIYDYSVGDGAGGSGSVVSAPPDPAGGVADKSVDDAANEP